MASKGEGGRCGGCIHHCSRWHVLLYSSNFDKRRAEVHGKVTVQQVLRHTDPIWPICCHFVLGGLPLLGSVRIVAAPLTNLHTVSVR